MGNVFSPSRSGVVPLGARLRLFSTSAFSTNRRPSVFVSRFLRPRKGRNRGKSRLRFARLCSNDLPGSCVALMILVHPLAITGKFPTPGFSDITDFGRTRRHRFGASSRGCWAKQNRLPLAPRRAARPLPSTLRRRQYVANGAGQASCMVVVDRERRGDAAARRA